MQAIVETAELDIEISALSPNLPRLKALRQPKNVHADYLETAELGK